MIPLFGSYEKYYYKHLCANVCLNPSCRFFQSKTQCFIFSSRVILCLTLLGTAFLVFNDSVFYSHNNNTPQCWFLQSSQYLFSVNIYLCLYTIVITLMHIKQHFIVLLICTSLMTINLISLPSFELCLWPSLSCKCPL